jgi:hypothetical protein
MPKKKTKAGKTRRKEKRKKVKKVKTVKVKRMINTSDCSITWLIN